MDKKLFEALVESFKEAEGLTQERRNAVNWRLHVCIDPHIMDGIACFAHARVPVSVVLHSLACGMSREELLAEFPLLTKENVAAALAYAAELTGERVVAVP